MNAKEVEGHATQDLTGHPWAGLKVKMTLFARDQAGQTGASEVYQFVLPERKFTKPLAKAIVEQRKMLVRKPHRADLVARALDALTIGAEHTFDKPSIYLSIRNAYWRLKTDLTPEGVASVADQLWDHRASHRGWRLAARRARPQIRARRADEGAAGECLAGGDPEAGRGAAQRTRPDIYRSWRDSSSKRATCPRSESKDGDQLVSQQDFDKMLEEHRRSWRSPDRRIWRSRC